MGDLQYRGPADLAESRAGQEAVALPGIYFGARNGASTRAPAQRPVQGVSR